MERGKALFVSFLLLYIASIAIVLVASTAKSPLPAWGGYLDVGIVALIFITGFAIHSMNESGPDTYISYQAAVYLFTIILVDLSRNT